VLQLERLEDSFLDELIPARSEEPLRAECDSQREFLRPFRGIERNRAAEPAMDQKHGYRSS